MILSSSNSSSSLQIEKKCNDDLLYKGNYNLKFSFGEQLAIENPILSNPDKFVDIRNEKKSFFKNKDQPSIEFTEERYSFENLDSFSLFLVKKLTDTGNYYNLTLTCETAKDRQNFNPDNHCSKSNFNATNYSDGTKLVRDLMAYSWKPSCFSDSRKCVVLMRSPNIEDSVKKLQFYANKIFVA